MPPPRQERTWLTSTSSRSVRYAEFVDDFEDGIFPDGGPGEPLRYFLPCGELGDEDESGGRLTLAGPDPTYCALPGLVGESVASFFAAAGDVTLRATFVHDVPALQQGYGVTLAGADGSDFASLSFARSPVPGLSDDALLVVLVDEGFASSQQPVAVALLTLDATSYVPSAVIELRLSIARSGSVFLPSGTYRTCPAFPCDPGVPFASLSPFAGGGALAAGEFHGMSLTVADVSGSPAPTPFAFQVEELRIEYAEVHDDFENGVFGDPYPYVQVDGTSLETGGALVLRDSELPSSLVAVDASLPAATSPAARYRFAIPDPCESYGVSLGNTVGTDFAALELVRRVLPGVGDDVLQVVAQSEFESLQHIVPVFERTVISETPLDDASLDEVVAIELEIEVLEEPAVPGEFRTLLPHGRYRLCTSPDCADADFLDLDPVTEPPADPGLEICGLAAGSYAPPPDAGRIDSGPPLGSSVLAVPEPRRGPAAAAALLASFVFARLGTRPPRRRSRGAGCYPPAGPGPKSRQA